MPYDFDVLVIGSGAGGGTFAYACARAGKNVLLVERGQRYSPGDHGHDERAMLIDKKPYDDRTIPVNGSPRRLYMGSVLGGSTALYGAALLRPSEDDFYPGKHYGPRLPRALWEWPVSYQALEPYYGEAERLYGVSGCTEDDFGPLHKPAQAFPERSIPLKPINQALVAASQARGLKPFRLPLAIDFSRCLLCSACPGYICPNGARHSSADLVERARAERLPLHVITHAQVEGLVKDAHGQVGGVSVTDRTNGQRSFYRARRYALAAGAIGSPTLLLRSGLAGPLVGRHYMLHLCPIAIGLFARRTGAEQTYVKQVGFADFYLGTRGYPHKMGLVQSLPVPGMLMLQKAIPCRVPQALLGLLRRHMLPLTGIVEDLPNPGNHVRLGRGGEPEVHHAFGAYDLQRGRRLGRLMAMILKNAGALACLSKSFPSHEHVAHQCGTLRFGQRAADAVVDADCRMFGQPDVFVVDGSFFPTSLGVGPALTIIANALRVADVVQREL
jgi:choline dehydrogenase-like flavoprotein